MIGSQRFEATNRAGLVMRGLMTISYWYSETSV